MLEQVLEQVVVEQVVGKVLLYRRLVRRLEGRLCRGTIHLSGFLFLGLSLLIVFSIVFLELLTFLTAPKLPPKAPVMEGTSIGGVSTVGVPVIGNVGVVNCGGVTDPGIGPPTYLFPLIAIFFLRSI